MREGLVSLVLLVLFFSCEKNPPKHILPAKTHSGEHTLGFYIDGEAWVPFDKGSHKEFELPKAQLSEKGALKISATRIDDPNNARNWFCIEIADSCFGPGVYQLSNQVCTSPYQTYYYSTNKNRPGETYSIDTLHPHFIEITHLNTQKKIIAGTFEFTAISNKNASIKISGGRFDLPYE